MVVLDVVEDGDAQPAHLEHVAKAVGGDEGRAGADALEDGVRGHRRGVHDTGDPAGGDAMLAEERLRARHDPARVVLGCREHLGRTDGPVVAEQDDVGERAADVDAEPEPLRCVLLHHSSGPFVERVDPTVVICDHITLPVWKPSPQTVRPRSSARHRDRRDHGEHDV